MTSPFVGYSTEQAEALVKVLTESLHNSVAPIEASVLSRSDLVSS